MAANSPCEDAVFRKHIPKKFPFKLTGNGRDKTQNAGDAVTANHTNSSLYELRMMDLLSCDNKEKLNGLPSVRSTEQYGTVAKRFILSNMKM